jgi:5'-3' exonuclease
MTASITDSSPAEFRALAGEFWPGSKVLAVDGTGMLVRCHKAAQRTGQPLTAADGTPTGTLMMFIGSLAKKLRVLQPAYAVITWDGPHARIWRQDLYPGYKANRNPQHEASPEQRLAVEFCHAAGLRQLAVPGYEADDLLAAVQRWVIASMPDALLDICTDDADLLQLLFHPTTAVTGLSFDAIRLAEDVQAEWGIHPRYLPCVRALAGDQSDNIPGLPGIGIQRAARMIRDCGYEWPLPDWMLPGAEQRRLVGVWRDVMELAEPPHKPEDEHNVGMDFFALSGRAEWNREPREELFTFLAKYQLSRLSERALNGKLW